MLTRLAIENLATVDSLAIEFGPGLTVLTGETGAGKSILFDALDLLFGARADSGIVRRGAAKCQLEAEVAFGAPTSPVAQWLDENELTDEDQPSQMLLRRVIKADGGSKAWVNGQQVTLALLRELAERVLDIHGQHAHQALLRPVEQRRIVDAFGAYREELTAVRAAHAQWHAVEMELERLQSAAVNDPAQRELLQYQHEELDSFAPLDGEFSELNAEFLRLNRIDELRDDAAWLEQALGSDGGVEDQLSEAVRRCERLSEADPELVSVTESLVQALDTVRDARRDVDHAAERLENDPERLAVVSARLDRWEELARKHRCAADALPDHAAALAERLTMADQDDTRRLALLQQLERARQSYTAAAMVLFECRRSAAEKLSQRVVSELPALGLPHARIAFEIEHNPEGRGPEGRDTLVLTASMNPGQDLAPLAKVASGGELARISLAIAVNAHAARQVPVLLFDEVDVGVGGAIASAIGEHLKTLADQNQVLCVTHQPQVAAMGDSHLQVSKEVADGQTFSRIQRLDHSARVDELSRMAGGREITAQTRAHAEALLSAGRTRSAAAAI